MKKETFFYLIVPILLFFFVAGVLAADSNLPSAGLAPDSPFYIFKTLKENIQTFLTFGAENKAKQFLRLADVRLAEYQKMLEKGKTDLAQKTLDKYEKQLNQATQKIEELKAKKKDVKDISEKLATTTAKHVDVLEKNLEKVPEQAKKGIERAIENARKATKKEVKEEGICVNQCGDGVCQEVVCLASGCPCAETKENCPQDCGVKKDETTGWKDFSDSEIGYSFKYPQDWEVNSRAGGHFINKSIDGKIYAQILTQFATLQDFEENYGKITFGEFVGQRKEEHIADADIKNFKEEKLTLGDKEAVNFSYETPDRQIFGPSGSSGVKLGELVSEVYVQTDRGFFYLAGTAVRDKEKYSLVVNQTLSTFRFLGVGQEIILPKEKTAAEKEAEKVKIRDLRRKADIRQIPAAMEIYYGDNNQYLQSKTIPTAIGSYLNPAPKDPLGSSYFWLDNASGSLTSCDSQHYCLWTKLEGGGFFAASEKGTKELSAVPTQCPCF